MPLRPLFVTGSLVHGGAERHAITLMNRLAARGHPCHGVYVKNDPSQLPRIDTARVAGVHCLDAQRFFDPAAVTRFAGLLARLRPTVLVTANGYALMYATLACRAARLPIPVVATFHTTQVFGLKEQVKALLDRPFFWAAACTVFVCAAQKTYWLRRGLGSRQNRVIYNGVDTTYFSPRPQAPARQALGLPPRDFIFGLPAVLRPEKNPVQLVEVLARLRQQGRAARLLLIGDGPLRPPVEARAKALGVGDYLHLSGLQQDVRPYLAACDGIVLPSLSETFSLAALEAMAMARPVLLSEVGGAAEMVFPGHNGQLFPVGDTSALVRHLAHLADDGLAGVLGSAGRRLVEERFSEAAMVAAYEQVLLDLGVRYQAAVRQGGHSAPPGAGGVSKNRLEQGAGSHENV